MFPSNCKAILKSMDENIVENGQVSVSLKERFAEFALVHIEIQMVGGSDLHTAKVISSLS